jgi:hypothetical protein
MRVIADLPPNVNALGNLAEDQYPLLGVIRPFTRNRVNECYGLIATVG